MKYLITLISSLRNTECKSYLPIAVLPGSLKFCVVLRQIELSPLVAVLWMDYSVAIIASRPRPIVIHRSC